MRDEDFVIRFAPGAGDAWNVLVDSPAGEGSGTFEIPRSFRQAPQGAGPSGAGGTREVDADAPGPRPRHLWERQAGIELFRALFKDKVGELFHQTLGRPAEGERRLRIHLEFDAGDPRLEPLRDLPWELTCQPGTGKPLALSGWTSVVRVLRVSRPRRPALAKSARPRVLVVASSPGDLPALDLAQERRNLEAAWKGQTIDKDFLDRADREELHRAFLERPFDVLHFMGHGGFDEASGEGVLYFEGPDGAAQAVSGSSLALELDDFRSLRVAILNACHTARSRGAFAGVAASLVLGGAPAVVAMRQPISDSAAIAFSRVLWERLAAGKEIEEAMVEARLAIHRLDETSNEWATPVLFLRAREEAPVLRYAAALVAAALGAMALSFFLGLGWLRDVQASQVLRLNNAAMELEGQGRAEEAEAALRKVLRKDPDNGAAHANLSILAEERGDYDEALAHARAAVEAAPGEAVHHYNLGALLVILGRDEEALASLHEAVRLEPGHAAARNELGRIYLQLDRPADARREIEAGLGADPGLAPLHKNLARVALAEGKAGDAVGSLETALSLYEPGDRQGIAEALYWLALSHRRAGRPDEACRRLEEVPREGTGVGPWAFEAKRLAQQIGCDGVF